MPLTPVFRVEKPHAGTARREVSRRAAQHAGRKFAQRVPPASAAPSSSQRQSWLWVLASRRHAGFVGGDALPMRLFISARPLLVRLGDAPFYGCLSLRIELR